MEQGGIEVPSFLGKSVRSALEAAQDSGLELDAGGQRDGARTVSRGGDHVAAGSRVIVKFAR